MKNFMNHDFNLSNIKFICHLNTRVAKDQHLNIKHHTITFIEKGKVAYETSDGLSGVNLDNYISFNPEGSSHYVSSLVPSSVFCIDFNTSEAIALKSFSFEAKNSEQLINLFFKANKIWSEKKPGYMMLCKAELYKILYAVQKELRATYLPQTKLNTIQPAIDYIHSNYTNSLIKIDTLSKICNISPAYLRRFFNSFCGCSPIEYINNLKISRAKELLKSNMYPINDIAYLCGYSSSPYFSREFKKATGFSPTEYMKSHE